MEKIVIDAAKCVGCGKCVKDCVASALYLSGVPISLTYSGLL